MTEGRPSVRPFFLDGPAGNLFAVHVSPPSQTRGDLIVVPPFAEELNRCRRVITEATRALAAAGFGSLVIDLSGTGNSEGTFSDARLETWREDIAAAASWVEQSGRTIEGLWGVRLGAPLAAGLAAEHPTRFPRLLLWQPVPSGRTHMAQFLRIRSAAAIAAGGDGKGILKELRADLARGDLVEVAGYELALPPVEEIEGVSLKAAALGEAVSVDWLEVVNSADIDLAPPKQAVLDGWRASGVSVAIRMVQCASFWMIEDNVSVPALVEETVRLVSAWHA